MPQKIVTLSIVNADIVMKELNESSERMRQFIT